MKSPYARVLRWWRYPSAEDVEACFEDSLIDFDQRGKLTLTIRAVPNGYVLQLANATRARTSNPSTKEPDQCP